MGVGCCTLPRMLIPVLLTVTLTGCATSQTDEAAGTSTGTPHPTPQSTSTVIPTPASTPTALTTSAPPVPTATACDLSAYSVIGRPQTLGRYTSVGLSAIWLFPPNNDIYHIFVLVNVAKGAPGRFFVGPPEALLRKSGSTALSQATAYGYQLPGEPRITPVPPTGLTISACSATYIDAAIPAASSWLVSGRGAPGTYSFWLPVRLPEGNAVAFSAQMTIGECASSPSEGNGLTCPANDVLFGIPFSVVPSTVTPTLNAIATPTTTATAAPTPQPTIAPIPTTIAVSPGSVTLKRGQTQQFAAVIKDQSGKVMSAPVVWSLYGLGLYGGTITTSGLFAAGTSGYGQVVATVTVPGTYLALPGSPAATISAQADVTVQ